jgi:hypothetical protein
VVEGLGVCGLATDWLLVLLDKVYTPEFIDELVIRHGQDDSVLTS